MTYTYAILEISQAAYSEIRQKLIEAGCKHVFHGSPDYSQPVIDMCGIALAASRESDRKTDSLPYVTLPNGCALYWKQNEAGGRTYYSDEIGGGVHVWDTTLVDESTLLAAIVHEQGLKIKEMHEREKER
jgi:hypothetical protein